MSDDDVPYFYMYLYVNRESMNIRRARSRLPENTDLVHTLRMKLFDALQPYMNSRNRDNFMVKLTETRYSYRVHLERLDGAPYDTPGEFLDDYMMKYHAFNVPECNLELEFEIDED